MSGSRVEFDMEAALGANPSKSFQKISLYLPNQDKERNLVPNIEVWIESGMHILADICEGVTRLPWSKGRYKVVPKDSNTGEPRTHPVTPYFIPEDTTILYSFIFNRVEFEARFNEIRNFLHDFGSSTNQDAVMVDYAGEGADGKFYTRAYYISQYVLPVVVAPASN
jgi:hypothetical protein